jgi:hypothetical protein
MSVEEFDSTPPAVQAVFEKIDAFGERETIFFETLTAYTKNRTQVVANQLTTDTESLRQAFYGIVDTAISSEDISVEERHKIAANTYIQAKEKRMIFFEQLNPGGEYEVEITHTQIIENIHDYTEAGHTPQDIATELTNAYIIDFCQDLDEFMQTLKPTPKENIKHLAQEVGRHAVDIGKLSAAVAIGTVVAKKFTRGR